VTGWHAAISADPGSPGVRAYTAGPYRRRPMAPLIRP